MFNNCFYFRKYAVDVIMSKNIAEPDRPQMTTKYSACALHARFLRLQKHTCNM